MAKKKDTKKAARIIFEMDEDQEPDDLVIPKEEKFLFEDENEYDDDDYDDEAM